MAQWKRAGLITRRTSDRNGVKLTFTRSIQFYFLLAKNLTILIADKERRPFIVCPAM
ncbi:hypothetical protein GGR53DRAFT_501910 [Hypoxylon sp. FL1150]|nr:hypothetical protein GGR53DRAFT_501910 [Hypoxylon sp. FL1150]